MTAVADSALEPALADAERDVVATVMHVGHLPEVAKQLTVTDFANPRLCEAWAAILRLTDRGLATDPGSVAIELERRADQSTRIGRPDLVKLMGECSIPAALPTYVAHVREAAERRRWQENGQRLVQASAMGDIDAARSHAANAVQHLAAQTAVWRERPEVLDLEAFINEVDPTVATAIPGVVERGERLILTGNEGQGKSTLLRQVAVQVAAGVHPFTLEPIDPLVVLLIDLENARRHVKREARKMHAAAPTYIPGHMFIEARPQGLDLLVAEDRAWLLDRIAAVQPALIVIGPLYKLATGDPTEEKVARVVAQALDDARLISDAALILEAHTPHATGGQRQRPIRPYGASLWLRWPEFGINLGDDGVLRHWRGARDERDWPAALQRGGAWPWTVDHDATPTSTDRPLTGAETRVLAALRATTEPMTVDALKDAARIKTRETVSRALNRLARDELVDSLHDPGYRGEKRWLPTQQEGVMSRDEP